MTPHGASPEPVLELRDLEVSFRWRGRLIQAVNGVSFTVAPGETVAIVGESGSGKSTAGLAAIGLIERTAGTSVAGTAKLKCKDGRTIDLAGAPERVLRHIRGNDVAMIFQEPMSSLNPVYSVGTQIAEAIVLHTSATRRAALEKARALIAELGIPDAGKCLASFPHQLSGGMRQRVMIAMALACEPAVLIADEPTTALDVTIQAQILELLKDIQRRRRMSIVFITHNLGVVSEIADRVIVMYAGKIVEALPVADLFTGAAMPYTRALLASFPVLGEERRPGQRLRAIRGNVPNASALPPGCAFHPRCQYARRDVCDREPIALEMKAPGHDVRCARWRDVEMEARA
jgi:oligopeptide transport system ATP-binding protein